MKTIGCVFLMGLLLPVMVQAKKLPKNIWSYHYKRLMVQDVCDKKNYYRSCYNISKNQCKKTVSSSLAKCFMSARLPSSIEIKRGVRYGYDIGVCVGADLDKLFNNKKLKRKKCNEAWRW